MLCEHAVIPTVDSPQLKHWMLSHPLDDIVDNLQQGIECCSQSAVAVLKLKVSKKSIRCFIKLSFDAMSLNGKYPGVVPGVHALYVHIMAVNEGAKLFYQLHGFTVEQEESSNQAHYR